MNLNKPKLFYPVAIILTIILLFAPLIHLKIGPLGYEHYGPNCPDIWIYGGDITGKDKSWWGIYLAFQIQRWIIIIYLISLVVDWRRALLQKKTYFSWFQLMLLVLFPLWLDMYQNGVQNNSDGADLILHLQWGLILYGLILFLQIGIVRNGLKRSRLTKTNLG